MDKRNLAFGKANYIILAIGMVLVVAGFVLMSGASSDESHFNADIFNSRRILVSPLICLAGFMTIVYAIIKKPTDE